VKSEYALVTEWLLFDAYSGHLQASLDKLLACCEFRPTHPPTLNRQKSVVAYSLQGEGLVGLNWTMVQLVGGTTGPTMQQLHGSSCLLLWALDGHIIHCCVVSSYLSAAVSKIVKHSPYGLQV